MVSSTKADDMSKIIKKMKLHGQMDQLKLQIKEQDHRMQRIKNERDQLKAENVKLSKRIEELEKNE